MPVDNWYLPDATARKIKVRKALREYFHSKGSLTERKVEALIDRWTTRKGFKFPPGHA